MLSDDTTIRFRTAVSENCRTVEQCHEMLRDLVKSAAGEARERGLTAAQFVLWVKQTWEGLHVEGLLPRTVEAARARELTISSAIKAYYVQ